MMMSATPSPLHAAAGSSPADLGSTPGSTPVRSAGLYLDRDDPAGHHLLDPAWAQLSGRKDEDTLSVVSNGALEYCAVFDGHRGKGVAAYAAGCLHDAIATELQQVRGNMRAGPPPPALCLCLLGVACRMSPDALERRRAGPGRTRARRSAGRFTPAMTGPDARATGLGARR